jgi:tRNA(fMet)-specific endonuclease VapC
VRYLLDTKILSDLLRHPSGTVAERIGSVGVEAVCTSIVVAAELRYGAVHKGSPRLVSSRR